MKERQELAALVDSCLTRGVPHEVDLNVPRHYIAAPVLRDAAYNQAYRGKLLPVVFADGSHPPRFPVGVFTADGAPPNATKQTLLSRQANVIKLGTMSLRHPDLDYLVDLYVNRNKELAGDETNAEKERIAFDRTVKLFADPAVDRVGEVWVYHTGLEPMIVGFYRGVVEVLRTRRKAGKRGLVFRPWLYAPQVGGFRTDADRDDDEAGVRYSPDSPGAKAESYEPCDPWF